jgi:hypothetical protein
MRTCTITVSCVPRGVLIARGDRDPVADCLSTNDYQGTPATVSCGSDKYCWIDQIAGEVSPPGTYSDGDVDWGCDSAWGSACDSSEAEDGECQLIDNSHTANNSQYVPTTYTFQTKVLCCKTSGCNTREALGSCEVHEESAAPTAVSSSPSSATPHAAQSIGTLLMSVASMSFLYLIY